MQASNLPGSVTRFCFVGTVLLISNVKIMRCCAEWDVLGCSVVLAGCEDVSDEGLLHLSQLSRLASLNLSNCCKVCFPLLPAKPSPAYLITCILTPSLCMVCAHYVMCPVPSIAANWAAKHCSSHALGQVDVLRLGCSCT